MPAVLAALGAEVVAVATEVAVSPDVAPMFWPVEILTILAGLMTTGLALLWSSRRGGTPAPGGTRLFRLVLPGNLTTNV